ncbi:MAG: HAD-IIIC family phosphatase [Betaproteobacteria bacterium]
MNPSNLPWLPAAPDDFRLRVRALAEPGAGASIRAQRSAAHRLDLNQLHTLGRALPGIIAREQIKPVRLGVLSNGTTDLILPAFAVSALRHGVWLECVGTAFDQAAQQALDPLSDINRAGCDFVLLALDHRGLSLVPAPGDPQRAVSTVDHALQHLDAMRRGLRDASGCSVIVQTIPQVPTALFGSLERSVPGTTQWMIDRFNGELRTAVAGSPDLILDVAALAETVGLAQWHDPVQWTLGKFPCAHQLVPLYAEWLGRLVAAARGKSRKCLVLDLDNTLWGGVIGDDGLDGIVLGNGSPAGEAFVSVQQAALALRDRGVILAVSSKNDDDVARGPFRSHPEMLLKEEHVAVFQANWRDKAANLKAIAETLNIGVDSLVLLDDNPAERAQVRDALPEVAVPELPEDPAFFAQILLAAGYFESTRFTVEDTQRAAQYQANAARAELLGAATDLGSYLRSLQMKAVVGRFDSVARGRITQLINKTNQFNLNTRRYTESQVTAFEESAGGLTLQIRLLDKFGDNGIVAIVICIPDGKNWFIDTWLMSCRVLNRKLEETTLNCIVAAARRSGVEALIGQYLRTERNDMVKDHYQRLGFERLDDQADGSRWRLEVAGFTAASVPIEIVEAGTASAAVPGEDAAPVPESTGA